MPAVQVVAAVGRHDGDRRVEAPGEQEAEHLAGGLVGPVHVLDEEQQRGGPAEQLERGVHRREQLGAVDWPSSASSVGVAASSAARCSGSTRRAGISRAMAGRGLDEGLGPASGDSAASRPNASLNGR